MSLFCYNKKDFKGEKMMDDLKRYEELVKTIEYHNDRYYNQDDPEISDYDYDMMMKELKKIEKDHPEYVTPNSPTQHVGGSAKREAGVLVRHRVPMLSLQDVFSIWLCSFQGTFKNLSIPENDTGSRRRTVNCQTLRLDFFSFTPFGVST